MYEAAHRGAFQKAQVLLRAGETNAEEEEREKVRVGLHLRVHDPIHSILALHQKVADAN